MNHPAQRANDVLPATQHVHHGRSMTDTTCCNSTTSPITVLAAAPAWCGTLHQFLSPCGGHGNQQTARCLGVKGQLQSVRVDPRLHAHHRFQKLAIRLTGTRLEAISTKLQSAGQGWQSGDIDAECDVAGSRHLTRVPRQAKARDIGYRMDSDGASGFATNVIQLHHTRDSRGQNIVGKYSSALAAVVTKPVPSALVNTNMSPGCACALVRSGRFHHSGHRQPILDFRVANRVASHNHGPDFQDPLRTAREYRMQDFQFELIVGEPDDIHG